MFPVRQQCPGFGTGTVKLGHHCQTESGGLREGNGTESEEGIVTKLGIVIPADFIHRQPFGGASGFVENIVGHLGVPVIIFGIAVGDTVSWRPVELGHNITFLPISWVRYPSRIPMRLKCLLNFTRFRRRVLQGGIDVLYVHSPETALPFLLFNKNVPIVFHQHGSGNPITRAKFIWARLGILEKIFDQMLRFVHRRSDWTIAIDPECYTQAEKNGIAHKTTLLMNAVDTRKFAPNLDARQALREEYGIPENTCVVLFAGRLEEIKRVDRVLDAMKLLSERTGNIRCFIAGDGTLRNALEEHAKFEGLSEMVTFLGVVPHHMLPGYYNMADLLVLPSDMEGTPMVLLEALACGTPVVASNVGGIPALIQNLSNGIVLDEVNPHTLADAILRIESMLLQREAVSQSVRHLSTECFIRELCNIFQNTLILKRSAS